MAVKATPALVQNPKITPASFTISDSANTKKTINTAGGDGSKVIAILATSTDTVARLAQVWLTRSGVSYLFGSTNIPAAAGTDGATQTANLLSLSLIPGLPRDNDGQSFVFDENADTIQVSLTTQVASGKEVDVIAIAGNF